MAAVAISPLCIVALLNAAATMRVVRSDIATRRQKTRQLLFVWFVPLIGALIALAVTSEARGASWPRRPGEPGTSAEIGAITGGDLGGYTHHGHWHDGNSGADSSHH